MAPKRCLEELLEARASVGAELRAVRRELRGAARVGAADRADADAGALAARLTPCKRQIAVALYLMADWSPAPTVDFLYQECARGDMGDASVEGELKKWLEEAVEGWVLAIPEESLACMTSAEKSRVAAKA
jgi:hypothetical protein